MEPPLHSGLVGRSPATLEKRVPINPDSADRRHPHEHFATRLRDRPRRAPRLRPLPAGTGADLRARTPRANRDGNHRRAAHASDRADAGLPDRARFPHLLQRPTEASGA